MSDMQADSANEVVERLARIETLLANLLLQRTSKDFYTTDDIAQILGKAEFTVREWCRHGRVHAEKRLDGRGKHRAWVIAHSELLRIQREGLLPIEKSPPFIP